MKRPRLILLSLRAILPVLAACIGGSTYAYDFSAKNSDDVEIFYNINPDGKTLTVTYGASPYSAQNIDIPQVISHNGESYTVTAIGNRAFEKTYISSVNLPATITDIQNYAFSESRISTINYPKSLKRIKEHAFYWTNVNNGVFPEGLEEVGQYAYDNTQLDSLYLPNTLISLGNNAFSQCNKLHTVKIPGSLKVVEKETFYNCPNLYKVEIEEGVESIGVRPYEGNVFQGTPVREISFPSSLKYIGRYCFSGNQLTKLELPNTIEELGQGAFYNSSILESITFSSGMTELPSYVCEICPKLIEVVIPEGIQKIGSRVFRGATLLSRIIFPESVTEVDNGALSSTGIVDFTFPKNLTYISQQMFEDCDNLTEFIVPESITDIRNDAFHGCDNLSKVSLPETLTSMGSMVFSYCSNLSTINIPVSLGTVPQYMFQDCKSLRKILIPEGITELDRGVFQGCINLTEIVLPKSLEIIRERIIGQCNSLRTLTIYHNCSLIEQHAFDDCNAIEEIHLYRAVLPETPIPLGWLVDRPVINADNNCTLFVPKGSVESYKESFYWNTFKDIVEEEITEPLNYQITFPHYFNGGSLTVNGEPTKPVMEFAMGSDIKIAVSANEGYHLTALLVNGKDVSSEMTDNVYTIKDIDSNFMIDATFSENSVTLSIFMTNGGSMDVNIEKKHTFNCVITPEEDWTINTITFNGMDVTDHLSDDYHYTTPVLIADSELRITFEDTKSGIEDIILMATPVKVYVDKSGLVSIEGLQQGVLISVYSLDGVLIDSIVSSHGSDTVQLSERGVFLIKIPGKTYKVQY